MRCKIWERRVLLQLEIFYDCDIAGSVSVARLRSRSHGAECSNGRSAIQGQHNRISLAAALQLCAAPQPQTDLAGLQAKLDQKLLGLEIFASPASRTFPNNTETWRPMTVCERLSGRAYW